MKIYVKNIIKIVMLYRFIKSIYFIMLRLSYHHLFSIISMYAVKVNFTELHDYVQRRDPIYN